MHQRLPNVSILTAHKITAWRLGRRRESGRLLAPNQRRVAQMQARIDQKRFAGDMPGGVGEEEKPSVGNVFGRRGGLQWRRSDRPFADAIHHFGGQAL